MGARQLAVVTNDRETSTEVGLNEKRDILAFFKEPGNEAMRAEFLKLSKVSNVKGAFSIARQWTAIAAAVLFATTFKQWWSYGIAMLIISTRQHALGIIMHEATHWRLFSKKWANDLFGNIFCAFPTNMTVSRYRYEHLLHHQYNMEQNDPYKRDWDADSHWYWPKTQGQAFWLFFKDLLSLNMSHLGPTLFRWSPWANHFSNQASSQNSGPRLPLSERLSLYGYLAVVATGLTLSGNWINFLLLWMLPMSTLAALFVRIRSVVEHLNLPGQNEFNRSRHVDASLLERLTVAPLNINIHIAHHLYPSVPQYNLPRMHQLLLQYPVYRQEARMYDTYFSFGKRAYSEMIKK
ncbi:MAG: fatty acid desaturase family protein [Bdellovibrionia bacterium]